MKAPMTVREPAGGAEGRRAWESLKLLEQAQQASIASHTLELAVLNKLLFVTVGGFERGSPEEQEIRARMDALLEDSDKEQIDEDNDPHKLSAQAIACMLAGFLADKLVAHPMKATAQDVQQAQQSYHQAGLLIEKVGAILLNVDVAGAAGLFNWRTMLLAAMPRQHSSPEFHPKELFGAEGASLRDNIER